MHVYIACKMTDARKNETYIGISLKYPFWEIF
jgi:hypothetical protein